MKKFLGPKFGLKVPKLGPKLSFCHFLKFGSLVFLEISYNDSLEQFLTSSRGKIQEKKFWDSNLCQRDQNGAQN